MGIHVEHGKLVMPALDIVAVPAFADNYLWLVHDSGSGETAVVDPGDLRIAIKDVGSFDRICGRAKSSRYLAGDLEERYRVAGFSS